MDPSWMREKKKKRKEKIRSFIYRKYRNRIRFVSIVDGEGPSMAWAACVRIKGIHRWCGCRIPRPIQTAMPNDVRHAHKQTGGRPGRNLFSIRPMRSKLIVPHFWYAVVISGPGLASLKRDPRCKKNIHRYCESISTFIFVRLSRCPTYLPRLDVLNTKESLIIGVYIYIYTRSWLKTIL